MASEAPDRETVAASVPGPNPVCIFLAHASPEQQRELPTPQASTQSFRALS